MKVFKGIEGIREIIYDDGFYRYITGEYNSLSEAKRALAPLHESGFTDAFIRELNLLINK